MYIYIYIYYISLITLHCCCAVTSRTLLNWHHLSHNFVRTFHLEEEQHYILHTVFPVCTSVRDAVDQLSWKRWFSNIHFNTTNQFSSILLLCRRGWSADSPVYIILTFDTSCVLLEVSLRRCCVLICNPSTSSSIPNSRWKDCRVPKQL